MCVCVCFNIIHMVGLWNRADTLWSCLVVSKDVKCRVTTWSRNSAGRHIPKKIGQISM